MKALRFLKEWKPWFLYVAIAVLGASALWIVSDSISKFGSRLLTRSSAGLSEVARLVELKGKAKIISEGEEQTITEPIHQPILFHDGDRLEFSDKSSGALILSSQDELKADPATSLMFQLWNKKDPQSPLYVHLLSGRLTSTRSGVSGRAYVIQQGKLFLPGQAPKDTRTVLVLNKSDVDVNLAENQLAGSAPDESEESDDTETSEPTLGKSTPETLSNEYIDETISRRQFQLQKCWMSRVRTSAVQKGRLIVQLEISRRGKVKSAQILDSELKDETLHKCVTDVVDRITFRSFTGPEISLTYPIQFE